MLKLSHIAAAGAVLALGTSISMTHVSHASPASQSYGYVYVNENTAGGNTVAAFQRNDKGWLTPLASSPISVGGAGAGAGLAAQNAIAVTNDGRFLLVADAGSDQISVLRVGASGDLTPVKGSPFASGGTRPVSIATQNNLVYVANAGASITAGITNTNYVGFKLDGSGRLTPLVGGSATTAPGIVDVLLSPDATHLEGIRVGIGANAASIDGTIESFNVDQQGKLTAAPGSPFQAQANGPFGSAFSPVNAAQLFVPNAHAGLGAGSVSSFTVAANGALAPVSATPYANNSTAPCWLAVAPDGGHLYTSNTAANQISSYAVNAAGSLNLVSNTTVFTSGINSNSRPIDLVASSDGHDVYALEGNLQRIGVFATNQDGTLSELTGSFASLPVVPNSTPSGIAFLDGKGDSN